MREKRSRRKVEKLFWGIFFVLAAVFLVVSQLGFLQGVGVVSILFAVFWVAVLVQGIWERSFGKILFPIAFLCIIFDKPLGIEAITPVTVLLAALLGTIGLNMIFKRKKHAYFAGHFSDGFGEKEKIVDIDMEDGDCAEEPMEQRSGEEGGRVFFQVNFGSAVKYVNSDHFEFADLECSFGGMKVFFEHTRIPSGNATVNLDVSFGGVELYIPKEWNVVNCTDAVFGGLEEKGHNRSNGSPVLTLTGDVSFSGVTVIYV